MLHGLLAASGEWMGGGFFFLQLLVRIACKILYGSCSVKFRFLSLEA